MTSTRAPTADTLDLRSTVAATREQVSTDLDGETVILSFKDSVYYGLDPVGTSVWNFIQEPRTVASVRDALLAEYAVDAVRCEQDLLVLLASLLEHGLIEVQHKEHA